jgi:hypothetical protein
MQALDGGHDAFVDQDRPREAVATMDDAVPDRVNRAGRPGIIGAQPGQGPPDGLSVVANGRSLAMRRGIADQKRTRGLIADPVDQAARQPASLSSRICRRRRLDELEFQG